MAEKAAVTQNAEVNYPQAPQPGMRLLLDTHTLVWALGAPKQLSHDVRVMLSDHQNSINVSVASIVEIAISRSAGSRHAPKIAATQAAELAKRAGYAMLPMTDTHAAAVETIAPFHGDPFDRLLLAQAQIEGLRLVTHDESLAAYDTRAILY
jgi:PIN domain nuclease of toxin-antitoxin system